MSSVPVDGKMTPDEFLAWERQQEGKYEYFGGLVVAMSGGTLAHSVISVNLTGILREQLRGTGCLTLQSDMRIWIPRWEAFVYPDAAVVCGKPEYQGDKQDTLTNPVLIVEVLSPSTEKYDRSDKFLAYQGVPSLKEYLLVSQEKKLIEQYVREGKSWRYVAWLPESETVELKSVPAMLRFDEVYEGVDVPAEAKRGAES